MKIPNPAELLRKMKEEKEKKVTAVELLNDRLEYAFKDSAIRTHFTVLLQVKKIEAKELMKVSFRLASSRIKEEWIKDSEKDYKFHTLQDVTEKGDVTFFKIMIIIREEFAPDIAKDISFKAAVQVILERVLFHK